MKQHAIDMFYFTLSVLSLTFTIAGAENIASSPRDQEANNCLLPPHPEHGRYTVSNYPYATPGERHRSVKLDISCDIGYLNNNTIKSIFCINGYWSAPMPICVRDLIGFCTLPTDDLKVEYRCLSFPGTLEGSLECESLISNRTTVRPICRFPAYFSFNILPEMHCRDGTWDYTPICKPACGLTTQHLQLEDTSTNHLELPWHAVIYKTSEDYEEYCGGSLITATKIISSAGCFFDFHGLLPARDFVVTVNKMYRPFNDTRDKNRQVSEVTDIIIPSTYRGYARKYEDDIAIVVVKTPFFFHLSVRPVCLDFDNNLDRTQLTAGNSGKIVGWIWIAIWKLFERDGPFNMLNVIDMSYLRNEDCENIMPTERRPLLTKDKFCARYNETWTQITHFGSGLAFLDSSTRRYYLLGVYSRYVQATDGTWVMIYTSVVKHEHFIKEHL